MLLLKKDSRWKMASGDFLLKCSEPVRCKNRFAQLALQVILFCRGFHVNLNVVKYMCGDSKDRERNSAAQARGRAATARPAGRLDVRMRHSRTFSV